MNFFLGITENCADGKNEPKFMAKIGEKRVSSFLTEMGLVTLAKMCLFV